MIRLSFILCMFLGSWAQSQVFYELRSPISEPISNTAVAGLEIDGKWFAYAFSGIDSTKLFSGIHARAYKYSKELDSWSSIPNLPSGQDRIAAGASAVRGKIYILGGYEVFNDGTEVSINSLHIFNPITDSYEQDATPIAIPIDDQVQCVYNDSLIYSITGWSNTGNVGDVWIYDVVEEEWQEGTSIPTTPAFKAFGASGTIVGDTIYFIGGAKDTGSFGIGNRLRKGYINSDDPRDISWSNEVSDAAEIYRAGSLSFNGKAYWLGGSENTYNYDGIAYNGQGGVPPTNILISYDPETGALEKGTADFPPIMDLRGLAQIGDSEFLSIGGMIENQKVTNKVVKYDFGNLVNAEETSFNKGGLKVYPNPSYDKIHIEYDRLNREEIELGIYDMLGRIVYKDDKYDGEVVEINSLKIGTYYVQLRTPFSLQKAVFFKL